METSSRKRSNIWTSFNEVAPGKVKCGDSNAIMSSGSASSLSRHLNLKHCGMEIGRQVSTHLRMGDDTRVGGSFSIDRLSPSISSATTPSRSSEVTTQRKSGCSMRTNGMNQARVADFIKSFPMNETQELNEQLVKMIAKEYQPLSLVEDAEFKEFVKMLNPTYALPSRKTLSTNLIPLLYKHLEKLRADLEDVDVLSLAMDGWTSVNNQCYCAITAHFINNECKLDCFLLDCFEFSESHTDENLSSEIKRILKHWNVADKVVTVVTDNSAKIKAAVRKCGYRHISCYAHLLNLVVQEAKKEIQDIRNKVKFIVEYFKRSPQATAKLSSFQKKMDFEGLKLKQDVPTRWNSTLDMFKRILALKQPVLAALAVLNPGLDTLSEEDWAVLKSSCDILKLFEEVILEISTEKSVNISKVLLLTDELFCQVHTIAQDPNLPALVRKMITVMKGQLNARFHNNVSEIAYTESTLLDPRFKRQAFQNEAHYKLAYESVSNRASKVVIPERRENDSLSSKPICPATSYSLWSKFDAKVGHTNNKNNTAMGIIELDKFLQEPLLLRTEDPLLWWKERRFVYPRLFAVMKRRLSIPPTSIPCERIFSKTGQLITDRRSRLSPKMVTQLIFLHVNM